MDGPLAARTVDAHVAGSVDRFATKVCLVESGHSLTYAQLHQQVTAAADGLAALGVGVGDRVAVWMSNRTEWVVTQLAVTSLGAVLVPLNTRLRKGDLGYVLADSSPRVVVVEERSPTGFGHLDLFREIGCATRAVVVDPASARQGSEVSWAELMAGGGAAPARPELPDDIERLAYLVYTSGTTSSPKGVMLAHRSLQNACRLAGRITPEDVILVEYPLFALTGCQNTVLAGLIAGATLVLHRRFDPTEALDLLEGHHVSLYAGHMTTLQELVRSPRFNPDRTRTLRSLSVFPCTGDHAATVAALGPVAVSSGYGMTETSGPVTHCPDLASGSMERNGWPTGDNQIRIAGPDGADLPPGENGEILVKGSQVMTGYYNAPDETARALDADGWLHTGDLGHLDGQGALVFVSRIRDVLKTSGFVYAASEVESVLRAHPGVKDAAVIPRPHQSRGEVGVAVIEIDGDGPDPDSLRAHCAAAMAGYKIPAHFVMVAELPRTATGKVRKVELAGHAETPAGP